MQVFESEKLEINNSQENIYNFLSNFNNFGKLMPEQVVNWRSTEVECSFTIKGMTDLNLKIKEKLPHTKVIMTSAGKAPFEFELVCDIEKLSENKSYSKLSFKSDMNPMLSMLASKPLQNFVNILNQQLKLKAESENF